MSEEILLKGRQAEEWLIEVGIVSAGKIEFVFPAPYRCNGETLTGNETAAYDRGKIVWRNRKYDELVFFPVEETAFFELAEVVIGINFHWERKERQLFPGILKMIVEGEKLTAVNVVPLETYLTIVISSEMRACASLGFLKAHAVISRSWSLTAILSKESFSKEEYKGEPEAAIRRNIKTSFGLQDIREEVWYDRSLHRQYDVCADDHCQRYQGLTKVTNPVAKRAVEETRGQVVTYGGSICDTRFSKCCGGAAEEFKSCWEDKEMPYLQSLRDTSLHEPADLSEEKQADEWIRSYPPGFCNTKDTQILSQILNEYDRETTDFYRWRVEYTRQQLTDLIKERSGIDFGSILELQPVKRGKSGRITQLRIVGTRQIRVIGKELEIRRILSASHLYSSAFVIDKTDEKFILTGAGWGHGVGLCQIGAAVMSREGYTYREILRHYYPETELTKVY